MKSSHHSQEANGLGSGTDSAMMQVVNEKTKIPIVWVFTVIVVVASGVLYLADMRADTGITKVKVEAVEQRVSLLEQDVKTFMKEIRDELKEMNRRQQNTH